MTHRSQKINITPLPSSADGTAAIASVAFDNAQRLRSASVKPCRHRIRYCKPIRFRVADPHQEA
jgi:hypothetical protein